MPTKIMVVVGARPNFMKASPILAAIRERNRKLSASGEEVQSVLVHTGQHYDEAMSGSFFADLGLAAPDAHLGVGSGSHALQTAEVMRKFEEVVLRERPDAVVVVGDVNSTLACALVCAKISFDSKGTRPLIAHVEAGLRSFDPAMPEEVNRIVTDHISDLLFVTEQSGLDNLRREGVSPQRTYLAGNTMIDSLLACRERAEASAILDTLGLRTPNHGQAGKGSKRYALLTLHRPSNVDDRETFSNILEGLGALSSLYPVVFPVHPRTRKRVGEFGLQSALEGIRLIDPLGYLDFLCLMKHAALVITDSGGIQEETTCLGVPCVTVRENTERPVTVTCGTNLLAGTKPEGIRQAIAQHLRGAKTFAIPEKWDGKAAERIVAILVEKIVRRKAAAESIPSHPGFEAPSSEITITQRQSGRSTEPSENLAAQ